MATGTLRVDAPLVVETYTVDNNTINANTALSVNYNIGKTGYTTVGVVGAAVSNATSGGANAIMCAIKAFFASGNYATLAIKNTGTATAKVIAEIRILYQKN